MYVTARVSWVSWNQSNLSPSVGKLSQAGATCAKLLTSQLGKVVTGEKGTGTMLEYRTYVLTQIDT